MQRSTGTLCHGRGTRGPLAICADLRARTLPLCGRRRSALRPAHPGDRPARRRIPDRSAARHAFRQAAEDAPIIRPQRPARSVDGPRWGKRAKSPRRPRPCASLSRSRLEEVSHHHRGSQHHRPCRPRSDGGSLPGSRRRRRGHPRGLRRIVRRGHGHGRTFAGCSGRPGGSSAHGSGRSAPEPGRGTHRRTIPRGAFSQLDGRRRFRGRGPGAVRRRGRHRTRSLSGARYRDSGRQGQPFHEHPLAGRRCGSRGGFARVPQHQRLCAGDGRAPHPDAPAQGWGHRAGAHRTARRAQSPGGLRIRAVLRATRRRSP